MSKRLIRAVDLYCGAGGSSTGLYRAAEKLGFKVDLTAINHWKFAIATHKANHPHAKHRETSINQVDPLEVVPGGRLDLLWASPECIHFSVARGGKPVRPQSRASGWHVLHWAETLLIDNIIIENVKEYRTWGPLKRVLRLNKKTGKNERVWIPDPKRKGETYQALLAGLRSLNFNVEERIINAADHGDPTTRERLFIIARRGRRRISWPEPTHAASDVKRLFGERKKWRAAREIIDWNITGQSIFTRKKPLATKTLERIFTGLEKFGGKELQPFLVILRNNGTTASVEGPIPTLTAGGNHVGLAEPFQVILRGQSKTRSIDEPTPTGSTAGAHLAIAEPFILGHRQFDEACVDSIERPLRTITAKGGGDMAVVEPFIVGAGGPSSGDRPQSVDNPLQTVLTENHRALVEPFLVPQFGERDGQTPRTHSVDAPLPAVTSHGAGALVEPCLVTVNHGNGDDKNGNRRRSRSINDPMPTLPGSNSVGVAEPFLLQLTHGGRVYDAKDPLPTVTGAHRGETGVVNPFVMKVTHTKAQSAPVRSAEDPLSTITTAKGGEHAVVTPMIAKYYGTGQCRPIDEPLDTISTKDRFGLVMPVVNGYALDIRFRMLQPKELAAAMGFHEGYQFTGNREAVVKQIGNAVCVNTAQALCEAVLQ
jgi:DNA (cytosine-5)-methyltransferase 1